MPSADVLRQMYHEAFRGLAIDSFDFGRELRRLIPRLVVFPVRLADGGRIVLRAKFRLQLAALVPSARTRAVLQRPLERVLQVDLFDPPHREKYRQQIMELRRTGHAEREAANMLGLTITAAQQTAALQRRMDELELSDAYVPVAEPPDDTWLRRHRHARYKFEPLEDAGIVSPE